MKAEVTESDGVILIDVQQPGACALALEVNEAIDLAQQLLKAVVEASKVAPFEPRLSPVLSGPSASDPRRS